MPFTTANSKKLFYTLTPPPPPTPPSGLTLLTIHGLGPTSTHFFPITAALAAGGHTVLSFDIDGCGRSPRSDPAADHTLRGIADDVLALIERFVNEGTITEKVVLVGHSMGGMIATEAAIKDGVGKGGRGRVVGVVEIGPPTVNPGVQKMMGGWVEQIIAGGENGMEQVGDLMTALSLSESATTVARAFVRSFYLSIAPESYVSLANAIIHSEVPDFAAVKVPLLVMDAEEDSGGPDHSLNGCQSVYDGWGGKKEFVVVRQAGHWHVVEQPEQVVDFIAKFISGL